MRSSNFYRSLKARRMSPALGAYQLRFRGGFSSWADDLVSNLTKVTAAVPNLTSASAAIGSIGADPSKLSYSTIATIGINNPELAAQYAAIKQASEGAVSQKAQKVAAAPVIYGAQATPAGAGLPAWAIPAAIGVGAVYVLTRKK